MDYEDYVCGDDRIYDFESDLFSNMATAEPWDINEDDWIDDRDYEEQYVEMIDAYNDLF